MDKLEKVIKGLKCCTHAKAPIPCGDCSYSENDDYNDAWSCRIAVMRDALELLKEQDEQKKQILKAVWDVLHEGVSTDTVADQDWVYEQIRNRVDKWY